MKQPKRYMKITWETIIFTAALSLIGCGGGGGGGTTASGGVTNTTVGAITGFGSVYVNGCRYHTDSSSFTVDDNPSANEDNLRAGDLVTVTSSSTCTIDSTTGAITGTGTATNITYADNLEGVVDSNSVTAGSGTMVVMGQTVTVNSLTLYQDKTDTAATVNDVSAGQVVEVSGYSVGTGTIVASRIEVKYLSLSAALSADTTYQIEVKGLVINLDSGAQIFGIGGLTVDYSSATIDNSISSLANDLYVEVKATTYTSGSALAATKVELENSTSMGHDGSLNHEVELRGLLTAYNATAREVTIGNYTFVISDSETEFRDIDNNNILVSAGETALANATIGETILKGNGKYNSAGKLIAQQIRWKDSLIDHDECKGTVSALNMTDSVTNPNIGTLTVDSVVGLKCEKSNVAVSSLNVTVDNSTIMHDSSSASVSKFNLSYLRDGENVDVHVDPATGIAIKLERKD